MHHCEVGRLKCSKLVRKYISEKPQRLKASEDFVAGVYTELGSELVRLTVEPGPGLFGVVLLVVVSASMVMMLQTVLVVV